MNTNTEQTRSVFDRLVDASYDRDTRHDDGRAQIAAIERDLENLLNSRQTAMGIDQFPELQNSIIGYGLPDANDFDLETPSSRFRLAQTIEAVIEQFEPRVSNVRVEILETRAQLHSLEMHIFASLTADPAAEIEFQTTLKLSTGHYVINSSR